MDEVLSLKVDKNELEDCTMILSPLKLSPSYKIAFTFVPILILDISLFDIPLAIRSTVVY